MLVGREVEGRRRARPTLVAVAVAAGVVAALAAAIVSSSAPGASAPLAVDSVLRIDGRSGDVAAAIPVGASPRHIAVDGSTVWVYGDAADPRQRLTRIDAAVDAVSGTFDPTIDVVTNLAAAGGGVWLGGGDAGFPDDLIDTARFVRLQQGGDAFEPAELDVATAEYLWPVAAAGSLWVSCCRMPPELVRIDPVTDAVLARVRGVTQVVAEGPEFVWALDVDATPALEREPALEPFAVGGSIRLARIDTATNDSERLAASLAVSPADFAFADGAVWMTAPLVDALVRLDAATGEERERVAVGRRPGAIAAVDGALWVALHADGSVARYDLETGAVSTIAVGGTPTDLAAVGDAVWVAVDVT